ncbi:probable uridine nucleosidase 2 isoform X2 [Cryptomeria japonica]|uniref:probable uridine nucleosidase 2 isoform X2 n=1 Tax=Cryptomeria japonica TaxID=3369 RepID=UPI0025AD01A3|nr:probable uridine nucleosidase 2 isoform X2 [Cryptomeria japonica]
MGELAVEKRKKIIIDTDPGIDDAMAIFLAFESPEVDVIGLTTIYGNVYTSLATKNALHLRVPKLRIADFVHGSDGLGNTSIIPPKGNAIAQSAAEFLVDKANEYPGEVTVVGLGPLTNIALAIEIDPLFSQKIGQIVILGGAFSMNGNVNPAAEANIFGDPEAADSVFTCGADIIVVGINVTHQVVMTDKDLEDLAHSHGKYAKYISKILKVYFEYHHEAYNICGVYLHDPTAMFAAINPSLMTYAEGVVRVQSEGIFRGLTVFDNMKKRWGEVTEWSNKPSVKVAVTVDADQVVRLLVDRLKNS